MANKIVVEIPTTEITGNGTTLSDAVALGPNERAYAAPLLVTDRTDGSVTLTVQTSISADGPWVTWFAGSAITAEGLTFDFPSITESPAGLLYARLSLVATAVTTGLTVAAQLVAVEDK